MQKIKKFLRHKKAVSFGRMWSGWDLLRPMPCQNMKKYLFFFSFLFLFLLIASPAWGATYYVDYTGGNDSNSGLSTDAPWKTITKVNSFSYIDGDSVLFKRSEVWSDTYLALPNGASNMTIADYGSGSLPHLGNNIVRPIDINWQSTGYSNLTIRNIDIGGGNWQESKYANLYLWYVDGVTIDGVIGDGHYGGISGTNKGKTGIELYHSTGTIEIKNSNLYNWGPATIPSNQAWEDLMGIIVHTQVTGTVSIHDNIIHDIEADAIQIYEGTAPTVIYNNSISNCGEQCIDVKDSDNVEIYNNQIFRTVAFQGNGGTSGLDGSQAMIGAAGYNGNIITGLIVHNNTITCPTPNVGCNGFLVGSALGPLVYDNKFDNVPNAVYVGNYVTDISIYYNLFINGAIYTNNIGTGTLIYNNSIYLPSTSTIARPINLGFVYAPTVKNNIVYSDSTATTYLMWASYPNHVPSDPIISNNVFYSTKTGTHDMVALQKGASTTVYTSVQLASFNAATLGGNLFADPLFVSTSDYHLQGGSSGINAGVDVGLTSDYVGTSVPQGSAPDIGAYEYVQATDTIPPAAPTGITIN